MAAGWGGVVGAGVLLGLLIGGAQLDDDSPPAPDTGTVTQTETEVETDGSTTEVETEQFVEQTGSGTVVRESTVSAESDGGGG